MDILIETKISCWILAFTISGFIALPFLGNVELKGSYAPFRGLEEKVAWNLTIEEPKEE